MIDDFLLVLFTLKLRDNLTMKKQMELKVLGCSSERKTTLFCFFLQALCSPKGSKRARVQRCETRKVAPKSRKERLSRYHDQRNAMLDLLP